MEYVTLISNTLYSMSLEKNFSNPIVPLVFFLSLFSLSP